MHKLAGSAYDRIGRQLLVAVCALVFIYSGKMPALLYGRVVWVGVFVLSVLWVVIRHQRLFARLRAGWPVVLIMLACLSTGWDKLPDTPLLPFLIKSLFAILLAVEFTRRERLDILLIVFTGYMLLTWLSVMLYPQWAIYPAERYNGAWRGLFIHKNLLGMVMGMASVFFLYRFWLTQRAKERAFFAFMMVSAMVLLWQSHSMTALIATAISMICGLTLRHWIKKGGITPKILMRTLGVALLLALLPAGAWLLYGYVHAGTASWLIKDSTLTGRTQLWQVVWPYIVHQPWGYGFTFWADQHGQTISNALGYHIPHSHNGLLEALLIAGIPGALCLLIALGMNIRRALGMLYSNDPEALWIAMFLVYFCIENIAENRALGADNPLLWILFIMLSFSRFPQERDAGSIRRQ